MMTISKTGDFYFFLSESIFYQNGYRHGPRSWMFKVSKFLQVSRVKSISVRYRTNTKFRSDRSNHCLDMAILRFFKMATAAVMFFLKFRGSET